MKLLLLAFLGCTATLCASLQFPHSAAPMAYELYSWQGSSGGWNFSVLASPSGPNLLAQEVFDKKFLVTGINELKRKISRLPEGSTVYWLDRLTGTQEKEGDKLGYPPKEIVQDIRRYAEARKIKLEIDSDKMR